MANAVPPTNPNQLSPSEYEQIGRSIEAVVAHGYVRKRRLVAANFLRGLFFGLGATLGVSIVLASLIYFSRSLSNLPLIGPIFERLEQGFEEFSGRR